MNFVGHAGERATGLVRGMANEEAKIGATTMEFYRYSLPAVPLLVVGFLFGEGVELVCTPILSKPAPGYIT